ncbi:hypothetical protein TI04_09070 [Achromatium sp. WMS2]|nr:hypothetical protein TI04_09070 [Achromatium sp. WMS2]
MSVTFFLQKNDTRGETITQHRSGDPLLCPVVAWIAVVIRVRSYPGTCQTTPVNVFQNSEGKLQLLRASDMLLQLRLAVVIHGTQRLGFEPSDLGTHSIRSGAAMAMYLNNIPVHTIMMIGRWSSVAFLRYIRKQLQEFSHGVTRRMLLTEQFYSILDHATLEDSGTSGHHNNFTGCGLISGGSGTPLAQAPAFALHY